MNEYLHVFIVGATNSGTGMLRFLLSRHPKITVHSQESHRFCDEIPARKGRLFSQDMENFQWADTSKLNVAKIQSDYYKHWKNKKNRRILVTKSPYDMVRMKVMEEMFKPAKFIGIVRNGFAVVEGLRRKAGHGIEESAIHWNTINKIMMNDSKKVDFKLIKYEDLVRTPQKTMNSIYSFLKIKSQPLDMSQPIPRENITNKHQALSTSFNKYSLKALTQEEKEIISISAKEMLEFFKYINV